MVSRSESLLLPLMLNTTRILALADLAEKQESKQELQGRRTTCAIGALIPAGIFQQVPGTCYDNGFGLSK